MKPGVVDAAATPWRYRPDFLSFDPALGGKIGIIEISDFAEEDNPAYAACFRKKKTYFESLS